jgi:hypothetical protein
VPKNPKPNRNKLVQPYGPAVPPTPVWLHIAFFMMSDNVVLTHAERQRLHAVAEHAMQPEIEAELDAIMRDRLKAQRRG